jgi:hypothetical protein
MGCLHSRKEHGQVIYGEQSDGTPLSHAEERCADCKARTRLGWVGKSELESLGLTRTLLPVFRDLRQPVKQDQPSLFGGQP